MNSTVTSVILWGWKSNQSKTKLHVSCRRNVNVCSNYIPATSPPLYWCTPVPTPDTFYYSLTLSQISIVYHIKETYSWVTVGNQNQVNISYNNSKLEGGRGVVGFINIYPLIIGSTECRFFASHNIYDNIHVNKFSNEKYNCKLWNKITMLIGTYNVHVPLSCACWTHQCNKIYKCNKATYV